ncbi:citrate synthase [Ichthyobacterium seriolicida]|uniref:Citrate synthase n=1 Tax=Ichthyobacterium seriolicida TaxID=242600 RepID=A0A1J1DYG7_9FLAO|nr:citrate synthase [Ichthyobacterium seriolicida]BAV94946.1 citrate synthase [Ichthyobacterium seriolicida]
MTEKVILGIENKEYELPLVQGTESELAIDITSLRNDTGIITLDNGLKNTGYVKSSITFLDGEKGILRHRGYTIEDLANKSTFLEVAYLLIFDKLPNNIEHEVFINDLKSHSLVNERIKTILSGFPRNAHPMGVLSSLISALTAFHDLDAVRNNSNQDFYPDYIKLIAKFPTIVSWTYNHLMGRPLNYPSDDLDYVGNFMNMLFSTPAKEYDLDPLVVNAMEKLFILHADHEQNCSTSTVRMVGSSRTNLYASISSGVHALWGALHGGANQAVIEMLEKIKEDGGNVSKYIAKAKDKNDPFRLMGFGHRVYKNFDPRANIIKKSADDILGSLNIKNEVLDIAKEIERVALQDDYFIERKLFPNVDFYSGIIYKSLGFPTEMFTVLFAMGRLPGWIAQWQEMRMMKEPISRPRQVYVGHTRRDYVPIWDR